MFEITRSSSASPADLWRVVSEVTGWPNHLDTFDSVAPAPNSPARSGIGARYLVRQPGLPAATYQVTQWDPGVSFTWIARSPGVSTVATHRVTGRTGGSELTLTLDWRGPLAPALRLFVGRRVASMVTLEAETFARIAADHA